MEIEPNAELRVVDRAFLHGDVVARAADALGAQGVVSAVHLDLDLRFADGSLVRGVNARRVAHVREFRPGHYVAYGDWVGKIHDVTEDVVVRFDDGAECVVSGADEETLVPRDRSTLFADEEHCPYFPGAIVHAAAPVWRDARWTRGTRTEAPVPGEPEPGERKKRREAEPRARPEEGGGLDDGGGGGAGGSSAAAAAAEAGRAAGSDPAPTTAPRAPRSKKKKSLSARVSAMRARTKGVVFAVRASEVTVRWLASARRSETDAADYSAAGAFPRAPRTPGPETEGGAATPPTQMPASALRPLTHFAHTCFQLGDKTAVPATPPPKSHRNASERRGGQKNASEEVATSKSGRFNAHAADALNASDAHDVAERENAELYDDGYDSDFPDVSSSPNDRYEGGGVDGSGVARAHRAASAGAGVAASVCESVGVALDVNRALTRLFCGQPSNGDALPVDPETGSVIPMLRPAATVVGTRTYVDVRWQDGSVTRRVAARDLVPQLHLGEHDFWPGQFVTRRADDRNPPLANGGTAAAGAAGVADIAAALGAGAEPAAAPRRGQGQDGRADSAGADFSADPVAESASDAPATLSPFGVVETVDQLERVATVRWLPPDSAFPDPSANTMRWVAAEERWVDFGAAAATREDDRERVSVYEIREDEEYGFRLGDIVAAPSRFDAELARRKEAGVPFECMLAHTEKDLLDLESDDGERGERGGGGDDDSSSEYEDAEEISAEVSPEPPSAATTASRPVEGTPMTAGEDRTSRSVREKPLVPPDAASLAWVGEVIGASDGFIRVAWGDGSVSDCHPKLAWVVSGDDDDSELGSLLSGDDVDSGDESDASWETLGEDRGTSARASATLGPDAADPDPAADPGGSDASPLGARRGVPEAAPSPGLNPPGGFSGAAALDPIARAYVERRREEAEFGWLAEHARRAGGPEPAGAEAEEGPLEPPLEVELADAEARVAGGSDSTGAAAASPPSGGLTPEEAARAAAALAAAFSGLRSAGSPAETARLGRSSEAPSPGARLDARVSPAPAPAPAPASAPALAVPVAELASDASPEAESAPPVAEVAEVAEVAVAESSARPAAAGTDDRPHDCVSSFPAFASARGGDDAKNAPSGSDETLAAVADHRFKAPPPAPADLVAWSKAVRKEWRVLSSSLPANVWVRVFEARTDLLRAAMLGPEGTPYHDNVFVFDFSFGPGYPNEPPSASYHARGERVNPNLYENGKVCLSLLATWSGKGSETWTPGTSNMLQVLVSIQGLVLTDDPYYNEAGYEKQSGTEEGKRNGDQYNEQAFLASARSMLSTLKDPPLHFERLIRVHFKARGPKILRVCRAYLDEGCPIGQYAKFSKTEAEEEKPYGADAATPGTSEDASESSESREKGPSKGPSRPPPTEGFKLTLRKLVPRLEAAFKANDELVDAEGA